MKRFLKSIIVFLLLWIGSSQVYAGTAYFNSMIAGIDMDGLNEDQRELVVSEAEAYERTIAPLYTTNLEEYKKKLNDFFSKLSFGFRVYNLTGKNEALKDSLESFYEKTNLKVYVISYVEGAFLNNLFQKLAELRYKIKANKSIEVKIKFKKNDETNDVDLFNYTANVVVTDVVRDTLKNIIRKKIQKQIDVDNTYNNLTASISGQNYAIFKTTSEREVNQKLEEFMNRFLNLGIKLSQSSLNSGPWATFIDPSGNAFSLQIDSDFRIVSAIKDGPILAFKANSQLYKAELNSGKFYWYQSSGGGFTLANGHDILPSSWGIWVVSLGNANAYTCYLPTDYVSDSKIFRKDQYDEKSLQYSQIPQKYASKNFGLNESFPAFGTARPACGSMQAYTLQFEGTTFKEEKIQFAGKEVTKITFDADKLAASAAELDKKYESVKKSSPGTKLSFHENGFIVTIDDNGKRSSKPISKEDFDKLVKKIESGDITTESEVIYSRDENNNAVVAGLGYNKSLKPGKPGFSFNTSQRTDLQSLQKDKINNYFKENGVTDLLSLSQSRTTDAFPDGVKTEIKSVSYFEVTLQVVRITGSIIRQFKIPDYFYDSAKPEYKDCMIHTSPYFSGVGNGLIEEALAIPQLIVLGTEILLDPVLQDTLVGKFKRLTPDKIKNGIINGLKSLDSTLTSNLDKDWHKKGKLTVQAATLVYGGVKILKKGADDAIPKNADEALEEIGDVTKKLEDLSSKAFGIINKLKNKFDELTDVQKELFKKDLDDAGFYKLIDEAPNPEMLVDAWKVLSLDDLLRKNKEVIELISYKLKQSGVDPSDLQKAFNEAADKTKWIDDLTEQVGAAARNLSGVAKGRGSIIDGPWLRGTAGNAGLFPESVAQKLMGRTFRNFDEFREVFWKTVAEDPNLSKQFTIDNFYRMKNGAAPRADASQWLGKQQSYILHHKTPIHKGGSVYDFDNLLIVTPRYHKEILDILYHFGH